MKILNSLQSYKSNKPATVTIGSFDGVHLGHQKVLNDLKQIAKNSDSHSVVISFEPHPRLFFNPGAGLRLLTTNDEKIDLLAKQNIDYLILQKFDKDFSNQTAEDFIKALVDNLNMKHLLIGHDHQFGKNRQGNFELIQSLGSKYGFKTHQIKPLTVDGIKVSSTLIREALQNGHISLANKLLGYPYFINGEVVTGNQLGRTIGFPTANINIQSEHKLLPKQGVYVVKSIIDGQEINGMMNLGLRPTVDGTKQIMEVHFFNFDKDIYGRKIPIYFVERLRDELKFPSLEALKAQLKKDAEKSLKILGKK